MHCWEKLKRFLGFDSHHGPDKSVRRPPAEQFQKLAKAGIQVEDRLDDGIPLKSAHAEKPKEEPGLVLTKRHRHCQLNPDNLPLIDWEELESRLKGKGLTEIPVGEKSGQEAGGYSAKSDPFLAYLMNKNKTEGPGKDSNE